MNNIHIQIAVGLIPAVALFLILFFVQKTHKKRNLIAFMFFLICCITCVIGSIKVRADRSSAAEVYDLNKLSIIYAVAEAGDPDQAVQMLQNLQQTQVVDDSFTLCAARLHGMKGDFTAAKALYEKVTSSSEADPQKQEEVSRRKEKEVSREYEAILQEYNAVLAAVQEDKIDYALTNLAANGAATENSGMNSADYADGNGNTAGYSSPDQRTKAADTAYKVISAAVKDLSGNEMFYSDAATSIIDASNLYNQFIDTGSFDNKQAEEQLSLINMISDENPELLTIPQFRIARLQMQILCEDYKAIAASVDDNSDYNELLIVSELYINSYLKNSYFPKSYTDSYKEKYIAVADQLEKVYENKLSKEDSKIKKPIREKVKSLRYAATKPALYHIEEDLLDYTKSDSAYDSTKVFLQLAKIESSIGNKSASQNYISSSLNTVGDCDDSNFTQPMYEIIGIISDKDDPERLKDVSVYVDKILTNTTTIQMSDKLTSPNPEPQDTEESGKKPTDSAEAAAGEISSTDFSTLLTDYVSQKRASVNIVSVDTSQFPKVKAVFNIDEGLSYSDDELASVLGIRDCGADISDFTIEKVDYTGANILLCCDVSGSMDGNAISHLKEAVSLFVDNRSDIENIALMTFSSGINEFYGFGSSSDELMAAAQSLFASGGTNMFDAVNDSVGRFSLRPGEINCIILLSDGVDNTPRSSTDISATIGSVCAEKGITLYSIGLGSSVDSAYLNNFSAPTGGSYLHVTDSQTLHSFYEYLHNQILNQYVVTFDAEDTLSISRNLKISLESDSLAYDVFLYSLESDSDLTGEDIDDSEDSPIYLQNKSISGLDTKLLYKGNSSYNINLIGTGFEESDQFSVSLKGNLDYESDKISCKFVDDTTVSLTIPAGVACGIYDVHVTINGKKAILDKGLTVVTQGSEKTTVFGPYVFTSYSKVKDEKANTITLSGYVKLNNWLGFKNEITLTGNLDESRILLTDNFGAYTQYYTGTSEGLASYFAKNNRTVDLQPLGTLSLYNDTTHSPSSDEYQVDAVPLPILYLSDVLTFSTPGFSLYPNRIVIDANQFTTDFPFQDKLLKKIGSKGVNDVFSFDLDVQCLLTAKNIGIKLEYSSKTDNKTYSPINLGAMPIYYSPNSFDIKINTIDNEYYIKYIARIAFIDGDGVGISLKWDGSLVPKEVHLYADVNINTTVSGVPVTYSNFSLGLTDINVKTNILNWKFEGGMDVSAAKVSAMLPKLEKWTGDVSVLKLEKAKLSFSLGKKYIGVSTDVKLFEEIKIAKALIEAGNFSYTNQLLNMSSEDATGLHAALTLGIMWESSNCNIDLSGTGDLAVANKVIGVTMTGTCDISVNWWVFEKGFYKQGSTFVGMYKNHKNEAVFAVKSRSYTDKGKTEEIFISWSKDSGMDSGEKKY